MKPFVGIKNIIFDWSGVLSDDFKTVFLVISILFRELVGRELTIKEFQDEYCLPYMKFWHKYLPGLEKETCDRLFLEAIKRVPDPGPFKNAKKVLDELKRKKIRMFVLSSHPTDKLMIEVNNYGFSDHFTEVKGSVHDKVDVIRALVEENAIGRENTLYIGDMVHDIDAGKNAGIKTVAITSGYDPVERLRAANPDIIIHDIIELLDILR